MHEALCHSEGNYCLFSVRQSRAQAPPPISPSRCRLLTCLPPLVSVGLPSPFADSEVSIEVPKSRLLLDSLKPQPPFQVETSSFGYMAAKLLDRCTVLLHLFSLTRQSCHHCLLTHESHPGPTAAALSLCKSRNVLLWHGATYAWWHGAPYSIPAPMLLRPGHTSLCPPAF